MAENVTIPHFTYVRDMFSNYLAIKKAVQEYRQDAGTAKEMLHFPEPWLSCFWRRNFLFPCGCWVPFSTSP